MTDTEQVPEMSELERIEVLRREDIAYSILSRAIEKFTELIGLERRIEGTSKRADSPWFWIVFVGGLLLQYFISNGDRSFGIGTWLAVLALGAWVAKRYEVDRLKSERERCADMLRDFEMAWNSVTGNRSLSDIRGFADEFGSENWNSRYEAWFADQKRHILTRVCGYEKGERISEDEEQRYRKSKEALEQFRQRDPN